MNDVQKIVWHLCQNELPSCSGHYLVSRLGFQYDQEIEDFKLSLDKDSRYIDIALFIVDLELWNDNPRENIYAWAELPVPLAG